MITRDAISQVHSGVSTVGVLALAIIFFRAYSMGAGTYTGIEAVSNGLPILREPRTVDGQAHDALHGRVAGGDSPAASWSATCCSTSHPMHGKTLNAVLFERVTGNWKLFGLPIGVPDRHLHPASPRARLLFVAAQTGFIDGPRVLATMARGPLGAAPLFAAQLTPGDAGRSVRDGPRGDRGPGVHARASRCAGRALRDQRVRHVHALAARDERALVAGARREPHWRRKLAVNGVGCSFTALILMLTVTLKFDEGGWVTVVITGALVALCYMVRRHYRYVGQAIEQLEADVLPEIFAVKETRPNSTTPPRRPRFCWSTVSTAWASRPC